MHPASGYIFSLTLSVYTQSFSNGFVALYFVQMCTHCAPAHTQKQQTRCVITFRRFHNCLYDDANDDDDVDDGDPCASILYKRKTMMHTSIACFALNAMHCNPFPFIQFGKYNVNVKSETISCTRNTNCIYYLVQVLCDDV